MRACHRYGGGRGNAHAVPLAPSALRSSDLMVISPPAAYPWSLDG